jgi:fibronectin type III domain protein
VTSYTVTVYEGSTVAGQVSLNGFPAPETAIVTGLVDGTSYTFYVSATNRAGTGPQSPPSEIVIPAGPSLLQ